MKNYHTTLYSNSHTHQILICVCVYKNWLKVYNFIKSGHDISIKIQYFNKYLTTTIKCFHPSIKLYVFDNFLVAKLLYNSKIFVRPNFSAALQDRELQSLVKIIFTVSIRCSVSHFKQTCMKLKIKTYFLL